jgi:mono/diheme cytochrome c family protein
MRKLIGMVPMVHFVIAIWAMAGSLQAAQVGSAERGLRLAREACAECHLVVKEAGRSTNPDAPTFEAIANTRGLTSAALTAVLRSSHSTMPNIVIKGDEINDIVAYILSLKERD